MTTTGSAPASISGRPIQSAGLSSQKEASRRRASIISKPFVIGAVIEMGLCLDLTTSSGLEWVRIAYDSLVNVARAADLPLPSNSSDQMRRSLDCAVIRRLHKILAAERLPGIDTVKGVFTEGQPLYPGAGFRQKTHIQIAVRNPECIKGVFRVSPRAIPGVNWKITALRRWRGISPMVL